MELKHIALAQLSISTANMRVKGKNPDIANILPSVRARGIIVPLIVRAGEVNGTYEIVAGKRRYHAALTVAQETGEAEPLPCAVIAGGDDAAALEASLIENLARLDPDEVTRWESFTRLVREGRSIEAIAATFGQTELQVRRTLALGNLLPRIRSLYRRGEIDAGTVRQLTLASKARQRDWLALLDDPASYCPTGHALKAWLFGGASIPVSAALFELGDYEGAIVADLFGDDRYFADTPTVTGGHEGGVASLYIKLAELPDTAVGEVLAIVMAETLDVGSPLIDPLGQQLGVDMAEVWRADDAMLDLIRDKAVLGKVLAEVAGQDVAEANKAATGKVKRGIIHDCLTGANGRAKVVGWIPRWLAFPARSYAAATVVALPTSSPEPVAAEPHPEPLAHAA